MVIPDLDLDLDSDILDTPNIIQFLTDFHHIMMDDSNVIELQNRFIIVSIFMLIISYYLCADNSDTDNLDMDNLDISWCTCF